MSQKSLKKLFGLAIVLATFFVSGVELEGQTTFRACRVPDVGAIYMIGVTGTPTQCLDASHVEFSWTEGGVPADGSITTIKLADGAVTQVKLDPGITLGVGPGDIGTTELADNAVTSVKIADGTITGADIAVGVIGSTEILDESLTALDIQTDAIGADEIAASSVGTSEIVDGAVTSAKLAVLPVASYAPGDFNGGVALVQNTYVDINSVSITVGGPGSIVVDGIAHLEVNGTNCQYAYYGIAETSGSFPDNERTFQHRSDYGAVGVSTFGYIPMVSQYLDVVPGAGTYTYYFTATRIDAVVGTCTAYPRGMTAMFFPS